MELTPSQIKYLYVIHLLDNPTVTSVSNYLGYKKPSTIKAFKDLVELDLLIYDKKNIKLTKLGEKYALNYELRKNTMVLFFTKVLNLDKEQAENDAENIMQVISCKTTVALNKYLEKTLNIEPIDMDFLCLGSCNKSIKCKNHNA